MILLPLARPSLGVAEEEAQTRVLRSGRLVLGPENVAFETILARATGRPRAVACSSGTAALHLALWALDLAKGEIIVPSFTFPAPANVAAVLGHKVVPVDVDPLTWNMDPTTLERALTPRTRAIVVVDQFGVVADHDAVAELARAGKIPLIEDAACAIGSLDARGRLAGSFGVLACLSFHPRKVVTTGEGGAVVGADEELLGRIARLRHHGIRRPGDFAEVGVNYRLPEVCAAVGSVQVERLESMLAVRRALAASYLDRLGSGPLAGRLELQVPPAGARPTWQTFAVVLPEGVDRSSVVAQLAERGIESGPATFAVHRIGPFANPGGPPLPVSDRLHDRALALPLWNGMTDRDVDRVVDALVKAIPQ